MKSIVFVLCLLIALSADAFVSKLYGAISSTFSWRWRQSNLRASSTVLNETTTADHLISRYNLTKVRKKGAVKELISFKMNQDPSSHLGPKNKKKPSRTVPFVDPNRVGKRFKNCMDDPLCPVCKISISVIEMDGQFVYDALGAPPYDHRCWSMRIRYHTAPSCISEEQKRGVVPFYKWRWTLGAVEEGFCRLPAVTPLSLAAALRNRRPTTAAAASTTLTSTSAASTSPSSKSSRPPVVLMLGLSFMGQPFMSLGCLFHKDLVGGMASSDNQPLLHSLHDITRDGGQCTGYPTNKISDFYPPALHPNVSMPVQNVPSCSMDHAYMQFGESSGKPDITFCYAYTFNIPKNVKKGQPLPCGLRSWTDVDAVLHLPSTEHMLMYVERTGGAAGSVHPLLSVPLNSSKSTAHQLRQSKSSLASRIREATTKAAKTSDNTTSHLHFINTNHLYEGLILSQLRTAYVRYNITSPLIREDFQARFAQCAPHGADVHFRMPGIPDTAMLLWLHLLQAGPQHQLDADYLTKSTSGASFWLGDGL